MRPPPTDARRTALGLSALFGAMYFVQGIGEPAEGLVGQPLRSLLRSQGRTAAQIATFSFLLGLPWAFKPLYGLLSDFVPLFGSRRRSYLIVATAATTFGLLGAYATFTHGIPPEDLLPALLVPSLGIAVADVVIDAVMVERGQRYGMTGRFQSVQWAAGYSAMIGTGVVGGLLSQHGMQQIGFLICGLAAGSTLVLTLAFVRDPPGEQTRAGFGHAARSLRDAALTPGLPAAAVFLFLWNFNPFANDVLYVHVRGALGFSDRLYGLLNSLIACGCVAASVAYGFYCRRVPFGVLLHASILLGVVATVAYAAVVGERSAMAVSLLVGFTWMTGVLIQLDLAARICPAEVAATAFALLMSLTNVSFSAAVLLGGHLYSLGKPHLGAGTTFRLIVALGATFSAAAWLLVPALLRRAGTDDATNADEARSLPATESG
jgi:hypothetical protein